MLNHIYMEHTNEAYKQTPQKRTHDPLNRLLDMACSGTNTHMMHAQLYPLMLSGQVNGGCHLLFADVNCANQHNLSPKLLLLFPLYYSKRPMN